MLLLVSNNVLAEWMLIGTSAGDDLTHYVDLQSIRIDGNKVKIWYLDDFKTVKKTQNHKYLSLVGRNEFDCSDETSRLLDFYWYSKNMGAGKNVYSLSNIKDEPTAVIPRTVREVIFKIACGK